MQCTDILFSERKPELEHIFFKGNVISVKVKTIIKRVLEKLAVRIEEIKFLTFQK